MPHKPKGLGILGALMGSDKPIRLPNMADDPRSIGFPKHHPPMRSFLGVPILAATRQLGQIYLTNKKGAESFSEEDEQIIQMLAGYAAAAIQNARLYDNLKERDIALTQRSEDLALLNDIAAALVPTLGLKKSGVGMLNSMPPSPPSFLREVGWIDICRSRLRAASASAASS